MPHTPKLTATALLTGLVPALTTGAFAFDPQPDPPKFRFGR
jgi:hypothetical protein